MPREEPRQQRLRGGHDDAEDRQRDADRGGVPAEPVGGIEHPDGAGHRRDQPKHHAYRHQRQQRLEFPQPDQRGERVEGLPAQRLAAALSRFGQDEERDEQVEPVEQRGGGEGRAQPPGSEQPAQGRPDDETDPHHGPHQAKALCPLRLGRDVGDVGCADRHVGTGDPSNGAADDQHPAPRRQRHQQIVDHHAGHGNQQHRPPAVAIAQGTEHRREHELHGGIHGQQHPIEDRDVAIRGNLLKQSGEDGKDQPAAHGVEHDHCQNDHKRLVHRLPRIHLSLIELLIGDKVAYQ